MLPEIEINELRKSRVGKQGHWTEENVKAGFRKFFEDYGRHPSSYEIDSYDYLPTARTIQRSFSGLVKFRTNLGHEVTDFGKGSNRSNIARRVGLRGRKGEISMQELLIKHFGEHYVHIERPLKNSSSKSRLDFYIYAKEMNFGVDVFFPDNFKSLVNNVTFKRKRYRGCDFSVFLVNLNPDINDERIKKFVGNDRFELESNIRLVNLRMFNRVIDHIEPL